MSTIHLHQKTNLTPEQYVTGLTDFGPGRSKIFVVAVSDGKNLRGWLLGIVVGTIGKGVLEKAFANSVRAIEARNGAAREARSS